MENLVFKNYLNTKKKDFLMSLPKEKKELEAVLRDNLITAYMDYAMEFGGSKAQRICRETLKLLKKNNSLKA